MKYAKEKNASCIMRYYEPESRWCCPPFYFYTREDAKLIQNGIDAGCVTDAPGSYIAWLSTQVPVYAMEMQGRRYDIGNLESYRKVEEEYCGIKNEK